MLNDSNTFLSFHIPKLHCLFNSFILHTFISTQFWWILLILSSTLIHMTIKGFFCLFFFVLANSPIIQIRISPFQNGRQLKFNSAVLTLQLLQSGLSSCPRRSTSLGLGTARFNRGLSCSWSTLSVCLSHHLHLPAVQIIAPVFRVCVHHQLQCERQPVQLEPRLESKNMISFGGLCRSGAEELFFFSFPPNCK